MDGFEDLRQKLDAIVEFISQKRLNPGFLEWELNALNSIYDNVVRYKKDLETSLSGSIFSKMKTPVCQISGIRKGVSDLGLLQRGRDDSLIDLIDRRTRSQQASAHLLPNGSSLLTLESCG